MNKSELIKRMCDKLDQLTSRGFGTFSNHYRKPRSVRNPKTGEVGINKPGKYVPHFKPGKELKRRVDDAKDSIA